MTTTPTIWEPLHQANPTDAGHQLDLAVVDIGLGRYVAVWTELNGGPIGITAGHDIVGQIYDHRNGRQRRRQRPGQRHYRQRPRQHLVRARRQ